MLSTSTTLLHSPERATSTAPTFLATKQTVAPTTCGNRCPPSKHKTCLTTSAVKDAKWDPAFWGKSWTEGSSASASLAGIDGDKKELRVAAKRPREGLMTEEWFGEMEAARSEAVRNVKGQ